MKSIFSKISTYFALLLFAATNNASSAEFKSVDLRGNGSYIITMSGSINHGDADKLRSLILSEIIYFTAIELNSPGGNLAEAIKISRIIQELKIATRVKQGGVCASACFLIWIAGEPRQASGQRSSSKYGNIGLHRPFIQNIQNNAEHARMQLQAQQYVSRFLEEYLLPRRLIDVMMSRASNEVYWLTDKDIYEIREYSSFAEELFISKCNYQRELIYRIGDLVAPDLFITR
jgi:hypothetical protein